MKRVFIFLLMMACGLAWAADEPSHPKLHSALNLHLQTFLGKRSFKPVVPSVYRTHLVDLNADGAHDALVLMLGRDWSGSGGQTMLVFRGVKGGFQFVSRMTCVSQPMPGSVCVMKERTASWRDLAIRVAGGGAKAKFVRMRFDGRRYPLNPTVVMPMKDWPRGEFVLASGDGTAKALATGRTYFTGLLGKSTRFQMDLKHERGRVTGTYFYEKYGTPILLEGEASGDGVALKEKSGGKGGGKVTATISLTRTTSGWTGQWRSADGRKKYPVRLQLVATEQRQLHAGLHGSAVRTAYPQFTGPAGRRFNGVVAKGFDKRFRESCDEFEEAFAELTRDLKKNPKLFGESFKHWTFEDSAAVRFFSADLISIRGFHYVYMGGAHGNYGDFPVNYQWRNGAARELKVGDLFDARKPWRAVLGRHLRRELVLQKAHDVVGGRVKESDLADSECFNFSPAGVEFHFAPYEVGPYAQGAFHVTVPFPVLRPVLRADGPLARWAK